MAEVKTQDLENPVAAPDDVVHDQTPGVLGVAPNYPPRDVTDRVKKAMWSEPRVRVWVLLTIAPLLVAVYLFIGQFIQYRRDAWLTTHGLPVDALVLTGDGDPAPGHSRLVDRSFTFQYEVNGETYHMKGVLRGHKESRVYIKERPNPNGPGTVPATVPLRVDPNNPRIWTARLEPPGLIEYSIPGLSFLPLVLLAAVVTHWQRARMLDLWRTGESMTALVLETKQVTVTPTARAVRCTPTDREDKRVLRVYVPASRAGVQRGDVLWIVAPPGNTNRALAACWFE